MSLIAPIHCKKSRQCRLLAAVLAGPAVVAIVQPVSAADKYWDINGSSAGSGQGTTTATWNVSGLNNWNTSSAGTNSTGRFSTGDNAFFSAGTDATRTYTISVPTALTAGALNIEEGTVTLTGSTVTTPVLNVSSTLTIGGTVALGTGTATVNNGGKLTIGGSSNITASDGAKIVLDGGTLENTVVSSVSPSFVSTNIDIQLTANGGTLSASNTHGPTIIQSAPGGAATTITGSGALTKAGNGVLAIATTGNTWSGGTIINAGEIRIHTNDNTLPTDTDVTVNASGILNLNGRNQRIASLGGSGNVGTGDGTLTINGSTDTTFGGALRNIASVANSGAVTAGSGRLIKDGIGTVTFNGANDIGGSVTLTNGGIVVGSGASLAGSSADLTVDGGTLTLDNAAQTIRNLSGAGGTIRLGAGHVLASDPVADTTYAGKITGDGGLTRLNGDATQHTLTLSGDNDYAGNTLINGGIISVASANALGGTGGYTQVGPAGELLFAGAATNFTVAEPLKIAGAGTGDGGAIAITSRASPTLSGPVTLTGDATVATAAASSLVLSGGVDGSFALTKAGAGELVLAGGGTYTGGTTVNAGTLIVNNGGEGKATGLGLVTVDALSVLTTTTGGTVGSVNVLADGTLSAAPGATLTVDGDAVIAGTASGNIHVTGDIALTGTASPGNSPGVMSADGDVSLGSDTLMELAGTLPTQYDRIDAGGNMTFAGTLTVTLISGFVPAKGDTFDLFDFTTSTGSFVAINLPALSDGLWDLHALYTTGTLGVVPASVSDPAVVAVPVPASALMGSSLLLAVGAARRIRRMVATA